MVRQDPRVGDRWDDCALMATASRSDGGPPAFAHGHDAFPHFLQPGRLSLSGVSLFIMGRGLRSLRWRSTVAKQDRDRGNEYGT